MEENALNVLYGCVSSDDAAKLVSSIFTTYISEGDTSRDSVMTFEAISWPRILLLARRACDSKLWADVKGSERASIESALHSCLCSPHVARESKCLAGILVVVRFLCLSNRNVKSVDDMERGYREYEKWLSQVTAGASKAAAQSICACLHDLVPTEPPRFLLANEKVLFRATRLRDTVADYLVLARTRLSDLDASLDTDGMMGRTRSLKSGSTPRAIAEVARFVAEFTRRGNVIPTPLVRQMNFHRHNFRSVLLEPLLAADLTPPQSFLNEEFDGGGLTEFNQQRVELIKTMAFDRKDKAVKRSEAEHAIAAIQLRMKRLNGQGRKDMEQAEGIKRAPLSKDSSAFDLVDGLRLAFEATVSTGSVIMSESDTLQTAEKRISSIIASKFASASRTSDKELVSSTDSFLEAILRVLIVSGACRSNLCKPGTKTCRGMHFEHALGWMRMLLLDVLCDLRLPRFRRVLQHRILLLLCSPSPVGSSTNGAPLGAFVYTLCTLKKEEGLFDLIYVLAEADGAKVRLISDVVGDELATSQPHMLRHSSMYALSFVKLAVLNMYGNAERGKFNLKKEGSGKENIAPPPISGGSPCREDEVPCSQSSIEDAPEVIYRDDGDSCAVAVPPALVHLLRWMTSSAWRLFAQDPWNTADVVSLHTNTSRYSFDGEAIALFDESIALLRSPSLSRIRLDPCTWTELELRAGWGCEAHALSVLKRFASAKDQCEASVIGSVAVSLSIRCSSSPSLRTGRFPEFHKPKGSLPLWILVALQSLSSETLSLVGTEDGNVELGSPVMTAFDLQINQGTELDCPRSATAIFLNVMGNLSGRSYFGNSSHDYVCKHVSQVLTSYVWPCSELSTRTMVNAYLSWMESQSTRNSRLMGPPLVIVTGLAIHWQALKDMPAIQFSSHMPEHSKMLVSKARSLWESVNSSLGIDIVQGKQLLSIQEDWQEKGCDFESILDDPLAFAIVLVYTPLFALARSGAYTATVCISHFKTLLRKLIDNAVFGLPTVLDTLAMLYAILPLSFGMDHDSGSERDLTSLSLQLLALTASARIEVCKHSGETICALSEGTRDWQSKSRDVFSALGFVPEASLAASSDIMSFSSAKKMSSVGPTSKKRLQLAQVLGRCRIAVALGVMSHESWISLLRIKDANMLLSDVVEGMILLKRTKCDLCNQSTRAGILHEAVATFLRLVPGLEEGLNLTVDRLLKETGFLGANAMNSELGAVDPALWRRLSGVS